MKHFILGFLVLSMSSSIIALAENRSQTAGSSDQQQNSASTSNEEPKGEVDLLIEELAKKNEGVLRHCLEKCDESKEITKGVSVGETKNKVQPAYPPLARAAHIAGEVVVMVVIDEEGKVIAAQVHSGHPLLRVNCLKAARESTFTRTLLEGKPIKVLGSLSYRFISQ